MMAFQNGFVVSVLVDNKPIRELNETGRRTCYIPFGAEYKLRLKNNNLGKRAYAKVSIDGTDVLTGGRTFILRPGGSVDLERFVNDLNHGNKFKFVSIDEGVRTGQIQDPYSPDNGHIRVEFHPEHIPFFGSVFTNSGGIGGGCGGNSGRGWSSSSLLRSSGFTSNKGFSATNSLNSNPSKVNCFYTSVGQAIGTAGATVEGGTSNQQFTETSEYFTTDLPVYVDLWLAGPAPTVTTTNGPWRLETSNGQTRLYYNNSLVTDYKEVRVNPNGEISVTL